MKFPKEVARAYFIPKCFQFWGHELCVKEVGQLPFEWHYLEQSPFCLPVLQGTDFSPISLQADKTSDKV